MINKIRQKIKVISWAYSLFMFFLLLLFIIFCFFEIISVIVSIILSGIGIIGGVIFNQKLDILLTDIITSKKQSKKFTKAKWKQKISDAFEQNRFILFFQPIIPTKDKTQSIHYEILVRLKDEKNNIMPPIAFLPNIEKVNMSPLLDKWVIENLFNSLNIHKEYIRHNMVFCINISGASLNSDEFEEFIISTIKNYSINPSNICFEITETIAIQNLERAVEFINNIKRLGCKFALDDFGSGQASFSYLKYLPIDLLKIDGIFIKDLVSDPIDRAMVESINQIGHAIGISTVAEFVKDEKTYQEIKTIGIDYAQGFFISKPKPFSIEEIKKL